MDTSWQFPSLVGATINKLARVGGGMTVDSSQLTFLPSSKSRDTKTKKNIKNLAHQIQTLWPSLRISGQLPAPIVNGGEDSFWKWNYFQLSKACDLDLGSGHTAYRCASLIDLYLHAKYHWNRINVLWTDGCTHGRTFETHFIRSTLLDLKTHWWHPLLHRPLDAWGKEALLSLHQVMDLRFYVPPDTK